MTWADPSTRATGDVVTSAIWNVQVTNSRNITYNQIQYGVASASANKSISAGAVLAFDTDFTVYEGYSDHTNLERLIAVKTGMHLFSALLSFSGATTVTLYKNNSALATLGSYTLYSGTLLIHLEADDYITLKSSAGVTMAGGSGMYLKLMSGGWTDYDYWGTI